MSATPWHAESTGFANLVRFLTGP